MADWHPINWKGLLPGETWDYPEPPMSVPALYWNRRANMLHRADTYRIATFVCENLCDCSHWMPFKAGMRMPGPPDDFSHFD